MRLFTAIELPGDVRKHLGRVVDACAAEASSVRWTPARNLHITLKFIGEVPDERVPEVTNALESVAFEQTLELRCERLVCFPPRGSARIIAAEVGGDLEPLRQAFDRLEAALAGFCLKERRRYTPHITLGRSKLGVRPREREAMARAVESLWPGPTFAADEAALMCSELSRTGPTYARVCSFG